MCEQNAIVKVHEAVTWQSVHLFQVLDSVLASDEEEIELTFAIPNLISVLYFTFAEKSVLSFG